MIPNVNETNDFQSKAASIIWLISVAVWLAAAIGWMETGYLGLSLLNFIAACFNFLAYLANKK